MRIDHCTQAARHWLCLPPQAFQSTTRGRLSSVVGAVVNHYGGGRP